MSNEPAQVIEAHGVYSGFDLSIRGRSDETEAVLSEGTAYCDGATITAPFTVALREGIEDGWHCLRINGGALEFGETFPAGCVPLYALLIDSGRFVAFRDMRRRIWIEYFDRGTESGEGRRDASFLSERPVYIHRVAAAMQDIHGDVAADLRHQAAADALAPIRECGVTWRMLEHQADHLEKQGLHGPADVTRIVARTLRTALDCIQ